MSEKAVNTNVPRDGVVWLAGEASGDFIASLVLPQVKEAFGGAMQFGMGGAKMREADLDAWYDCKALSVRGYVEVISHLPRLFALRSELIQRFTSANPRVFVGVDAPDFNLGVETQLRRAGIPVVHMVSPSIWAWRPERIQTIRRAVDHMLCVFPFEKAIYDKAGIGATYIGHPLANIIPDTPDTAAARKRLGLPEDGMPVVCVMPGSRASELKGCAGVFFDAMERLIARMGSIRVVVPTVDHASAVKLRNTLSRYPALSMHLHVEEGNSHTCIEASDAVLVASGTATLEAALYKKPMVVGYKMPAITGLVMEKQGLIPYVSLPSILCGERVVPEFLQFFCEPDPISYAVENALTNEAQRRALEARFAALHESLKANTAEITSDVLLRVARPL